LRLPMIMQTLLRILFVTNDQFAFACDSKLRKLNMALVFIL